MKIKIIIFLFTILAILFTLDTTVNATNTPQYNPIYLGTLGGNSTEAYSINNNGQVVGVSAINQNYQHAFLWENGQMTDLGTLGGNVSDAKAINNKGEILGHSYDSTSSDHTVLWIDKNIVDLNLGGAGIPSRLVQISATVNFSAAVVFPVISRTG